MGKRSTVRIALAVAVTGIAVFAAAPAASAQTTSCQGPLKLAAGYWSPSECKVGWTCQKVSGCQWRPVSGVSLFYVEPGHIGRAKSQSRWTLVDKNPLNGFRAPVSFGQACSVSGGNYSQCETSQGFLVAHKGDQVTGLCWTPALLTPTRYFAAYVGCQLFTQ